MTDLDGAVRAVSTDGRNARRERNVTRVLDVVLEMFGENALFPTMDQVADRSGLSLRSLYRYFADPAELVSAAIERHSEWTLAAAHLPAIGEGDLATRIDDFASMRVGMWIKFEATFRATLANASRHEVVAMTLAQRRREMRKQVELQFSPELSAMGRGRSAVLTAADGLTQMETVYLMFELGQTEAQVRAGLVAGLRALFDA